MVRDRSILRHLPRARAEYDDLLRLRGLKTRQSEAVKAHRAKIKSLLQRADTKAFFDDVTSEKLQLISRHLNLLSRKILTDGPGGIPEDVYARVARVPDLMTN